MPYDQRCPNCGHVVKPYGGKVLARVLKVLEADRGRVLSLDLIAQEASCALSTVRQMVSLLRNEGHVIRPVRRQGYRYEGKVA